MSRNWIIAGVAAVCFITGVALSHRIEPGGGSHNFKFAHAQYFHVLRPGISQDSARSDSGFGHAVSRGPEFARCGASRIRQSPEPRRHAAIES
jgi:hypothetical protein